MPKSFQNTSVTESGLGDSHKLIVTFVNTQITRLKPKLVFYRNYKHFNDGRFLNNQIAQKLYLKQMTQTKNSTKAVLKTDGAVKRHVHLKKMLRDNQDLFITKELRKEIYTRNKLKNKYN